MKAMLAEKDIFRKIMLFIAEQEASCNCILSILFVVKTISMNAASDGVFYVPRGCYLQTRSSEFLSNKW